jgi:hypothetical protein
MVVINGLLPQRGKLNDRLFRAKFWKCLQSEAWTVIKRHVRGGENSNSYQNTLTACLQNKTVSQKSKDSLTSAELQGSLPCSEEHIIRFCPQLDESTLQRRFIASRSWSYATGCVVAAKLKNCSALQTSLTAHPSKHHQIPEELNPHSTTVITSNLPVALNLSPHNIQFKIILPLMPQYLKKPLSFRFIYHNFSVHFLSLIWMLHGIHIAFLLIWPIGTLLIKWYSIKAAHSWLANITCPYFSWSQLIQINAHHIT